MEKRKTGVELIAAERQEQIEKHGRTLEHDSNVNSENQLAWAAAHMAYPGILYPADEEFVPEGWNEELWAKMMGKQTIDKLIIAGALIAAELDRIIALDK